MAIHAGQEPEKNENWAVIPPISMSSTFKQPEAGITKGEFDYSRAGNPTRHALEEALAGITGAKYGFAFASGLAGTVAIMSLLKSGDHVIAMNDLYGGTNRLFRTTLSKFGLEFSFVDARNPDNIAKVLKAQQNICGGDYDQRAGVKSWVKKGWLVGRPTVPSSVTHGSDADAVGQVTRLH